MKISLGLICVLSSFSLLANESVREFSSSSTHTLLLLEDGSSFGSGFNENGALGGNLSLAEAFLKETSVAQVRDVATGKGFSLWVDQSAQLWASGNSSANLFLGANLSMPSPTIITTQANLIEAGPDFIYMTDTNGALWTWGKNQHGLLGDGTTTDQSNKILIHSGPVLDVHCGTQHGVFVTATGNLYGMGNNQYGALGGSENLHLTPKFMDSGVTSARAGTRHTVYLKSDGSVWVLGSGDRGQLGDGSGLPFTTAKRVINSNIKAIAAGDDHTLALTQLGNLFGAGANDRGSLGLGTNRDSLIFTKISGNVTQVWAKKGRTFYTKDDGKIYSVGDNPFGQLGGGLLPLTSEWTSVVSTNVASIDASERHGLLVKNDGSLWATGESNFSDGSINYLPTKILSANVTSVSAGKNHSLILLQDGTVWAFGQNAFGQLGVTDFFSRSTPVQVHAGPATAVSAGEVHSLILLTDGTLLGAGDNSNGQLGQLVSVEQSSAWVQLDTNIKTISAGSFHNLYTKSDDRLWAVGRGAEGQLGQNAIANRFAPTDLGISALSLEASGLSSYIVDAQGNLMVFGDNRFGQLGTGNLTQQNIPVTIATNVSGVSASSTHAVVQLSNGNVMTMGQGYLTPSSNVYLSNRLTPVTLTVPTSASLTSIVAGGQNQENQTWALLSSGNLLALGHHQNGELGLGKQSFRTLPVFIGGGQSLITSSENILVEEEEILDINADELQENDEILDQDTGPQLRQVSGSAGGCLLKTIHSPSSTFN